MQYMLLIHGDESRAPAANSSAMYDMGNAYRAYTEALRQSGALILGDRLKPSPTGAVVRVREEATEVLDGPLAKTDEQLGGYYLINAADFDAAVALAAKCPGASLGTVEVREVWQAKAA